MTEKKLDTFKKKLCKDIDTIENFNKNITKKLKNTCVYVGSFFEGKGVEQIFRLAKKNPSVFFHIYGEKKYLKY